MDPHVDGHRGALRGVGGAAPQRAGTRQPRGRAGGAGGVSRAVLPLSARVDPRARPDAGRWLPLSHGRSLFAADDPDRVVHGLAGDRVDSADAARGIAARLGDGTPALSWTTAGASTGGRPVRPAHRGGRNGVSGPPARRPRPRRRPHPARTRVLQRGGGGARRRRLLEPARSAPLGRRRDARGITGPEVPRADAAGPSSGPRSCRGAHLPLLLHVVRRRRHPRWAYAPHARGSDLRRGRPHLRPPRGSRARTSPARRRRLDRLGVVAARGTGRADHAARVRTQRGAGSGAERTRRARGHPRRGCAPARRAACGTRGAVARHTTGDRARVLSRARRGDPVAARSTVARDLQLARVRLGGDGDRSHDRRPRRHRHRPPTGGLARHRRDAPARRLGGHARLRLRDRFRHGTDRLSWLAVDRARRAVARRGTLRRAPARPGAARRRPEAARGGSHSRRLAEARPARDRPPAGAAPARRSRPGSPSRSRSASSERRSSSPRAPVSRHSRSRSSASSAARAPRIRELLPRSPSC